MRKPAAPRWFTTVPADRRRVWTPGDSKMVMRDALDGYAMRLVLLDGTVLDGTYAGDRNFWGTAPYGVAVHVPGRKTRKWVTLADVRVAHFDSGPSLGDMVSELIEGEHDREERYLGTFA
jgi:hypothetical protein